VGFERARDKGYSARLAQWLGQSFVQYLESQGPVILVTFAGLLRDETRMGQAEFRCLTLWNKINPKNGLRSLYSLGSSVAGNPSHFDELVLHHFEDTPVVGMSAPIVPVVEEVGPARFRYQGKRSGLREPAVKANCPGSVDFFRWLLSLCYLPSSCCLQKHDQQPHLCYSQRATFAIWPESSNDISSVLERLDLNLVERLNSKALVCSPFSISRRLSLFL
jgi:hypothetical protein